MNKGKQKTEENTINYKKETFPSGIVNFHLYKLHIMGHFGKYTYLLTGRVKCEDEDVIWYCT